MTKLSSYQKLRQTSYLILEGCEAVAEAERHVLTQSVTRRVARIK